MKFIIFFVSLFFFQFSVFQFLNQAQADEYHYKDLLIGDRASGLGGAYIALSDDPSGMWYNPAGIMFSFENYFSLSANAYSTTSEVFKSTIAGKDYSYKSSALIPNYFGFIQNFDKYKWGFSIVVPNSDLYDLDDEFLAVSATVGAPKDFHRKFYRQNQTTAFGLAAAGEISKNTTFGISIYGVYHIDKVIDNQLIIYNADAGGVERYYFRNTSQTKSSYSLLPKLGFQIMPTTALSIGFVISKPFHISGNAHSKSYDPKTSGGVPVLPIGDIDNDLNLPSYQNLTAKDLSPLELGLGIAYFPDKSILFTGDFSYHIKDDTYSGFNMVNTWNLAAGAEYFITENTAMRLGLFTNNANTPQVEVGKTNQPTHVDLYGMSASLSFFSAGSAVSFGTNMSSGKGKGQAIGDSTVIHDVVRDNVTVFLTGNYRM